MCCGFGLEGQNSEKKVLDIFWQIIYLQVMFMKFKIMKKFMFSKDYFSRELNGISPLIKPTKTNRSNVKHKVVLILSFQLISNIFYISLHIF